MNMLPNIKAQIICTLFPLSVGCTSDTTVQAEDKINILSSLSAWTFILDFSVYSVNQLPSGTIIESEQRRCIREREARGKMRLTNRHKDMQGSNFAWSLSPCSLCTVNELIQV